MKNILKYILIGFAVVILEWIFVVFCRDFINGASKAESVMIGTGFFLAFEMVICTGLILSKFDKDK